MMKSSMQSCCPVFSTNRMVREYAERFYLPAAERWHKFEQDNYKVTRDVAAWRRKVTERWNDVQIEGDRGRAARGWPWSATQLPVQAKVRLGSLDPKEVSVELYYGPLDARGLITMGSSAPLQCQGKNGSADTYQYTGVIPCEYSGHYGYALRILPHHPGHGGEVSRGLVRVGMTAATGSCDK